MDDTGVKPMASDLIARLEGLSGPDREVDRVLKHIFGHDWDYSADWDYWDAIKHEKASKPVAKPYTASIDAALSLVPEGCIWNLGGDPKGGFASAGLFGAAIQQGMHQIHGEGVTPAIALCIAALNAKEAGHD